MAIETPVREGDILNIHVPHGMAVRTGRAVYDIDDVLHIEDYGEGFNPRIDRRVEYVDSLADGWNADGTARNPECKWFLSVHIPTEVE